MQVFILLLKIVNFLLKQLDIEASKLEGRRVLNIIGVYVEEICLHLNRNRNDKKKTLMSTTTTIQIFSIGLHLYIYVE